MDLKTSNRLPILADRIRAASTLAKAASVEAAEQYLEAGRLLIEAKDACPHGEWGAFLGKAGIHDRQARRLMRLAKSGLNSDTVSEMGIKGALELIAKPKPETDAGPDPDAVEIGCIWEQALANMRHFARTAREMREYFTGDDQRLKAGLMAAAGIGRDFAERAPELIDSEADAAAWFDAMFDDVDWLADSYEQPKGRRLLHGTHEDLDALFAERNSLRDEVETASATRLDEIIDRCHEIEIRSYAIRRSASEAAAGLDYLARMETPA